MTSPLPHLMMKKGKTPRARIITPEKAARLYELSWQDYLKSCRGFETLRGGK